MIAYGKQFFTSFLGILKFIELILSSLIIAVDYEYFIKHEDHDKIFDVILASGTTSLILCLFIVLLSISCGHKCDRLLQWQCVFHFGMCLWFWTFCIILVSITHDAERTILGSLGIVIGAVYTIDTIFSYKAYAYITFC